MKKIPIIGYLLLCLLIGACSANNNKQSSSGDWASYFVVWNGYMYNVTDENSDDIESELGMVEEFSDDESKTSSKVFSNKYPVGTKLYKIKNVSTDDSIAVEDEGKYIIAKNAGKYDG